MFFHKEEIPQLTFIMGAILLMASFTGLVIFVSVFISPIFALLSIFFGVGLILLSNVLKDRLSIEALPKPNTKHSIISPVEPKQQPEKIIEEKEEVKEIKKEKWMSTSID